MTTLYAYANPRGGGGYDAGDPNEVLLAPILTSTTAVLAATTAILMGAGDRGVQDIETGASDDLIAQSATMVGAGRVIDIVYGTGALAAARSIVVGGGIKIGVANGSGAIAGRVATMAGVGFVFAENVIVGSAVLEAQSGSLSGVGALISIPTVQVSIPLVNESNVALPGLTNLKWCWFDQLTPDQFTAPTDQGSFELTDGTGVLTIPLPNSAKAAGEIGWLLVSDSDGTLTQNPSHRAFSGPVVVQ
jgi:hypothetical protein